MSDNGNTSSEPLFPNEIMNMIWENTLPGPNIITLSRVKHNNIIQHGAFKVSYKIPTLLHICARSRHFALKYYTIAYSTNLGGEGFYIDFNKDALLFKDSDLRLFLRQFFNIKPTSVIHGEPRLRHMMVQGRWERTEANRTMFTAPTLAARMRWYEAIGKPETIVVLAQRAQRSRLFAQSIRRRVARTQIVFNSVFISQRRGHLNELDHDSGRNGPLQETDFHAYVAYAKIEHAIAYLNRIAGYPDATGVPTSRVQPPRAARRVVNYRQ